MASKLDIERTLITTPEGSAQTPAPLHISGAAPFLGELFAGRYELLTLLGEGGMGAVYRARDVELDEIVALKLLHSDVLKNADAVSRFKREVKLARRITHRNVARTFDLGDVNGVYYLTMEFIEGRSLTDELEEVRGRGMELSRFFSLALQICEGLEAAHQSGVIHRDLKPDNILIEHGQRVALSDFGIARQHKSEGDLVKTAENAVLGTPAYMAPEQIDNKATVDKRADLYALGAILFEMLTGSRAWLGDDFLTLTMARFIHPPPNPRDRKADIPELLADMVVQCLAKEADKRFVSAHSLAASLLYAQQVLLTPRSPHPMYATPASNEAWGEQTMAMPAFSSPFVSSPSLVTPNPALQQAPSVPQESKLALSAPWMVASSASSSVALLDEALFPTALSSPVLPQERDASVEKIVVAVLPFRHNGPSEDEFLTEGFVEDFIDSLSMQQTIKVRPYSMVMPWKDMNETLDIRGIGERLGVHKVVEGSLTARGDSLTVRVRMVSVVDGVQVWAHRLQTTKAELFQGVNEVSQALLEKLTVQCEPSSRMVHHQGHDSRVVELYLRARQYLRKLWNQDLTPALELFEQARIYAPDDPLILSAYAVGLARQNFFSPKDTSLLQKAQLFVDLAMRKMPERAEIHFAQGMLHFVQERLGAAIQSLEKALEQSSTSADAADLLGRIKSEVGDLEEAAQHLELAAYLDPLIQSARVDLSRTYVMLGRWDKVHELWGKIFQQSPVPALFVLHCERMSLWREDGKDLEYGEIAGGNEFVMQSVVRLQRIRKQKAFLSEDYEGFESIILHTQNDRLVRLLAQQMVEALCFVQKYELALDYVRVAVERGLSDLNWFYGCPLLEPLWSQSAFVALQEQVKVHVQKKLQLS